MKRAERVNLHQRSITVQKFFLNNAKYLIQIQINYFQFNIFALCSPLVSPYTIDIKYLHVVRVQRVFNTCLLIRYASVKPSCRSLIVNLLVSNLSAYQHIRMLAYLLVSSLPASQYLIRSLVPYPLVSISTCQHLLRLLANYPLVSVLTAR